MVKKEIHEEPERSVHYAPEKNDVLESNDSLSLSLEVSVVKRASEAISSK